MHFTKSLAAGFCLASIALSAAVDSDFTERSWSELSSDLARRQAADQRIVQIVTVGDNNGSLRFFPEQITAEIGSVVQFQFYPKNHTITESSFAAPCKAIAANLTTPERPGQRSGFVPVQANTDVRPIYNLIVNDTKPMWIFCGQQPHCQKGMSMVINQNMTDPEKTLEKYKAAAAALSVSTAATAGSSSTATATSAAAAGDSTVTPVLTTSAAAGPSLAGTATSAAAQSGSSSASIATFSGAAEPRHVPMAGAGVAAVGALWALL